MFARRGMVLIDSGLMGKCYAVVLITLPWVEVVPLLVVTGTGLVVRLDALLAELALLVD